MSNNKIKIAIIGLGNISLGFDLTSKKNQIFTHTKAILKDSRFKLVGGVDLDRGKRKQFEEYTACRAYASVSDLFSDSEVDAVIIAVPTHEHFAVVHEVVKKKPRGVLLEKPIAPTYTEAKKIFKLLTSKSIKTQVNYVRLFDPYVKRLAVDIKGSEFGKLQSGTVVYSKGLYNNASHFISLLIELFGVPYKAVPLSQKRKSMSRDDYDIDFKMDFKCGSVHFQCIDERCYSKGDIDLFFTKGRVRLLDFTSYGEVYRVKEDKDFPDLFTLSPPKKILFGRDQYQKHSLDQFYSFLTGLVRDSSFENALQTMKVCNELFE